MLQKVFEIAADDYAFITKMNERFPHLLPAFKALLAVPPEEREAYAREKLKTTLRKGYLIRGIPLEEVETVHEHKEEAMELARQWVPKQYDLGLVLAMLDIHDIAEAIVGDFTIHDDISKPEKFRLEEIAARLVFAAAPERLALWLDFENKKNPEALIGHDVEKAQLYFRCLRYEEHHPGFGFTFDDFWNNKPQWNTELGDILHQYSANQRRRLHGPPQVLPVHPKNQ